MRSTSVAFMRMSPGRDRDRAWAAETAKRGPSNPEHEEEILKPWEYERAEVKCQGKGLWRWLRSCRKTLTIDFRQGKVLDSPRVKTENRTRGLPGSATKHFSQDVTTSLVQRLEPIAWLRLNDLDCNDGGTPLSRVGGDPGVGDPPKAKAGEKGQGGHWASTHVIWKEYEFHKTYYATWMTWGNWVDIINQPEKKCAVKNYQ